MVILRIAIYGENVCAHAILETVYNESLLQRGEVTKREASETDKTGATKTKAAK